MGTFLKQFKQIFKGKKKVVIIQKKKKEAKSSDAHIRLILNMW